MDKVEIITADMLKGYDAIGNSAFWDCENLKIIEIPNGVKSIGRCVFYWCSKLNSVTFKGKTYKKQEINENGKTLAYKAFRGNMTCRDFHYEEEKTYTHNGEVKLCESGFHACLSLADVFNYYCGNLGKNIHLYEVELNGVSSERYGGSKVVAKQITLKNKIC